MVGESYGLKPHPSERLCVEKRSMMEGAVAPFAYICEKGEFGYLYGLLNM
jgi:hypothetical protein